MNTRIRPSDNPLQAPYIKVDAEVIQAGTHNGKPNIVPGSQYIIAPSAKKISTYIVNQILGSELVTQTDGLSVSWLMPTLREALELGIYQTESFVYIHKYNNKIYLECLKPTDLYDINQKYDNVISCKLDTLYDVGDDHFVLKRYIEIINGNSYINCNAFKVDAKGEEIPVDISYFNSKTDSNYMNKYVLPYAVVINFDLAQDFFKDSKNLLQEEMNVINILNDELEKTRTRIVTTQHYQTNDVTTNWRPNTNYSVNTLSVGHLQDYFTLLPGDKEHQLFEFLQGSIRYQEYTETFKFLDYQIIQMAGLSPASFGYEKDAYMNTDNINLSKNNSDMTVESIKSQIEPQIDSLIENIIKAQRSEGIDENALPDELNWDYADNDKLTDMKKLQVMNRIQSVMSIPYSSRAKIVMPILNKLIDSNYDEKELKSFIDEHKSEEDNINIKFDEE